MKHAQIILVVLTFIATAKAMSPNFSKLPGEIHRHVNQYLDPHSSLSARFSSPELTPHYTFKHSLNELDHRKRETKALHQRFMDFLTSKVKESKGGSLYRDFINVLDDVSLSMLYLI
jgi:hypothetical protein